MPKNVQLCWNCSTCPKTCPWLDRGEPVEGWEAVPTYIPQNIGYEHSYNITACPLFTPAPEK